MSTLYANLIRLAFIALFITSSGCSLLTPKPEVVDTQEAVLGPIEAELQKSFSEALVLLRDEEYAEAEALLIAITQKFPSYAGPWANLAIAQSKQEKFPQALQSLEKSLAEDDKFCPAISQKGVVLRELGQFQQAKEQYLAALACNPNDAMAIYNLGVLSDLYMHDEASALAYYQQYLQTQSPENQEQEVKNWVVDLKRRVPASEPVPDQQVAEPDADLETTQSEPQLAGEEL